MSNTKTPAATWIDRWWEHRARTHAATQCFPRVLIDCTSDAWYTAKYRGILSNITAMASLEFVLYNNLVNYYRALDKFQLILTSDHEICSSDFFSYRN